MNHRLEPHFALDQQRRGEHSHATLRARAVRHVHGVDAGGLEGAALLQHRGRVHAFGRHDLDARHQLAAGELGPPPRPLGERHGLDSRRSVHLGPWGDAARLARHDARHVVPDLLDVLGRRAAAAAYEARPGLDHAPGVARHVLRGGQVDLAVTHLLGQSRVGLGRDRPTRGLGQLLDGLEHPRRAHGAVHPDHVGAPVGELAGEDVRSGAEIGEAVGADGHLAHDGEVGAAPHRPQRGVDLVEIAEGLQDESVHAARDQAIHLAPEERLGLLTGGRTEGLDAHPQRTDRAYHRGATA